jgi:hypothetical protein
VELYLVGSERGCMNAPAQTLGSPSGEPSTTTRPMPQQKCEKLWALPSPNLANGRSRFSAMEVALQSR